MKFILGSRSPQRSELLKTIVAESDLLVCPPLAEDEPGFDGLDTLGEIEDRIAMVVERKFDDVREQLAGAGRDSDHFVLIAADTVVVATTPDGTPVVLGKPPNQNWKNTVRKWFSEYYADAPHQVWTCFQIKYGNQTHRETVKTEITIRALDQGLVDWYLSTGEPIGKAGGYGVQGIASMFVESMTGSLTNVVGLPMFEVTAALRTLGAIKLTSE